MTGSPPSLGQFPGQCQGLLHGRGAELFGLRIQVSVDVGCGGDVTVAQPFLNLLHGHSLFQQQAGTGVAQIMEPDMPQPVVLQQLGKPFGHCVGKDEVSHLIHEQVALVLSVIAVAAEFLVVLLLRLQVPQPLGEPRHQGQGPQTGLGLGSVRLDKDMFSIKIEVKKAYPSQRSVGTK